MNRNINRWVIPIVIAVLWGVQLACGAEAQQPVQREGKIFSISTQIKVRPDNSQYLHLFDGKVTEGEMEMLVGYCISLNDSVQTTTVVCALAGQEGVVQIHDYARLNQARVPKLSMESGCYKYEHHQMYG